MDIDIFLFLFGLLSPLFLFLFFRNLLDNKNSWKRIIQGTMLLAFFGFIFTFRAIGSNKMNFSVALIFPLYAVAIYRPLFLWFNKRLKHPPIDTAYNWKSGLFWDRLFNISYVLLITVVSMLLILLLASVLK